MGQKGKVTTMVKISIITTSGTYAVFTNTAAKLIADSSVLSYLTAAWNAYGRSASVYVDDSRVFLDKPGAAFTFSTQANLSDAVAWTAFLVSLDSSTPPGPPLPPTSTHPLPGTLPVYRMVLETKPGQVDTGASYSGCSRSNSMACQPIQFASIQDAVEYAYAHNEIPYRVFSAEESWQTIEGVLPLDTSRILGPAGSDSGAGGIFSSPGAVLLIGAGLLLLAGRGTR